MAIYLHSRSKWKDRDWLIAEQVPISSSIHQMLSELKIDWENRKLQMRGQLLSRTISASAHHQTTSGLGGRLNPHGTWRTLIHQRLADVCGICHVTILFIHLTPIVNEYWVMDADTFGYAQVKLTTWSDRVRQTETQTATTRQDSPSSRVKKDIGHRLSMSKRKDACWRTMYSPSNSWGAWAPCFMSTSPIVLPILLLICFLCLVRDSTVERRTGYGP